MFFLILLGDYSGSTFIFFDSVSEIEEGRLDSELAGRVGDVINEWT